MDTHLTLTKLKDSLDHNYVKKVASHLILVVKRGDKHEQIVLDKPFAEKIENICNDHEEDCTLKGAPHIKIIAAKYTTTRLLTENLQSIHEHLQK